MKILKKEGELQKETEKKWKKTETNEIIKKLKSGKKISDIFKSLPDLEKSFAHELNTIVCSDERVPAGRGYKIGLAGQLILASRKEQENFIRNYQGRIKTVTSHDNCGAAALKFEKLKSADRVPYYVLNGDQLGILHSQALAKRLGAEYRHIGFSQMSGAVHDARMICFDGTGLFNPAAIKSMPPHYVCSAPGFGLSDKYCQQELAVLTGIALGNHGFDGHFSENNPFWIICSAKNQEQLNNLTSLVLKAISKFASRVKVDGFIF